MALISTSDSLASSMNMAVRLGVSPARAALTEIGMVGNSEIAGRYVEAGVYERTGDPYLAMSARTGTSLLVYGGLTHADARVGMSGIRHWNTPKVNPLELHPAEQTVTAPDALPYPGNPSTYAAVNMTAEDIEGYLSSLRNGTPQRMTAAEICGVVELDKLLLLDQVSGHDTPDLGNSGSGVESGSISVQHAVGSANQAQSVLNGIDPKYFNPESRFGGGFYVGADSNTIVVELAEHGNSAKYAISYDMNLSGQNVLDLTNSAIASKWGYVQNLTSTEACQEIGVLARNQGYNVIKFQSYRGDGINYVIYNNFEDILIPRIVTPVE